MMNNDLPRQYLRYPDVLPSLSTWDKIGLALRGLVEGGVYWCLAYATHTPGLRFRKYFALKGLKLLFGRLSFKRAYQLLVMPMDTLRYFEFEFIWAAAKDSHSRKCLDVSSPRLLPLMLADRLGLDVELVNPDEKDLSETMTWAELMGVDRRCGFHAVLIDEVQFEAGTFDLVTSVSVVEHIADDKQAVCRMWGMLKPGGRLLMTVPCAVSAYEEYTNRNDYGLTAAADDGYVFFQRFYDQKLLEERLFSVTGRPARMVVYGEKVAGTYQKTEFEKRSNPAYPYWRTPLDMGKKYEYKRGLADLSGIGVVALEFVKG